MNPCEGYCYDLPMRLPTLIMLCVVGFVAFIGIIWLVADEMKKWERKK